ncbi:unnamed protein product [Toxocara canis]|uniref:Uncharacterized protein n=1 Tax=Toxocara canis TaxID=6265 RepID=A0A183V5Y7_TOXCA|nr:unnamed protein product [Toxocara canis]
MRERCSTTTRGSSTCASDYMETLAAKYRRRRSDMRCGGTNEGTPLLRLALRLDIYTESMSIDEAKRLEMSLSLGGAERAESSGVSGE